MLAPQPTGGESGWRWDGRSPAYGLVVGALLVAGLGLCYPCALVGAQDKSAKEAAFAQASTADGRSGQGELTIPPEKVEIVNEDQRPSWVEHRPFAESGVLFIPVSGDPKPDKDGATEAAIRAAVERARKYAQETTGLAAPAFLTEEYVRSKLIEPPVYVEEIRSPTFGTLFMGHVRLKMDRSFTSQLDEWKRAAQQRERVEATAVLAGGTLIVMALAGLWLGRKSRRAAHLQHWEPPPGMAEATAHHEVASYTHHLRPREHSAGWLAALLLLAVAGGFAVLFWGLTWTVTSAPAPASHSRSVPPVTASDGKRRLVGKARNARHDSSASQVSPGAEAGLPRSKNGTDTGSPEESAPAQNDPTDKPSSGGGSSK